MGAQWRLSLIGHCQNAILCARTVFLTFCFSIVLIFPRPWSWHMGAGEVLVCWTLASRDEWYRTIEEAAAFQAGNQLLLLFVCILLNCYTADPLKLCDDLQLHLSDNCSHLLPIEYDIENPSNDHIKSLALSFIRESRFTKLLQKNNSDLDQHHLPPPAQSSACLADRVLIAPRNVTVTELNETLLDSMPCQFQKCRYNYWRLRYWYLSHRIPQPHWHLQSTESDLLLTTWTLKLVLRLFYWHLQFAESRSVSWDVQWGTYACCEIGRSSH